MDRPLLSNSTSEHIDFTDTALEIVVLKASLKAERQRALEYQGQLDELAVLRRLCTEQRQRIAQLESANGDELRLLRHLSSEQRQRIQQLEAEQNDWLERAGKLVPLFREAADLLVASETKDNSSQNMALRLAS